MGCEWNSKHKHVQCNCERHYKKLRKFVFGQLRLVLNCNDKHNMTCSRSESIHKSRLRKLLKDATRVLPRDEPKTHSRYMIRWRRTSREMCCVIKDHMSLFWKGGKKDESLPSENVSILGKCHRLHTDKWRNPKGRHKNLLNIATVKKEFKYGMIIRKLHDYIIVIFVSVRWLGSAAAFGRFKAIIFTRGDYSFKTKVSVPFRKG